VLCVDISTDPKNDFCAAQWLSWKSHEGRNHFPGGYVKIFFSTLVLLCSQFALATNNSTNSFIVKLKAGESPAMFAAKNKLTLEAISPEMGLYNATSLNNQVTAQSLTARRSKEVSYAQENHPVKLRKGVLTPNDQDFGIQWNWLWAPNTQGVDAIEAWASHGTGGKDIQNNEIVVAIVDGGFDYKHPDLINNAWVNKNEIPGNGKDDDNNGYVDDIYGWNPEDKNGTISMDDHGTHVAGIIGAEGNNKSYVTGINWKIKIMYISAGYDLSNTALVMSAYGYILKQKQLWISSGGKQGANVVAVNSSFGIDEVNCNSGQYSVWNDMYNELGKSGVLSVAATANAGVDVDRVGDLPTSCDSDYLIAVTNSESTGKKNHDAGYGAMSIDLAAPGENIYSTLPQRQVGEMSGTSMATPHVTGAIGYLYSAASASLMNKVVSSPGAGALAMKEILLNSVSRRKDHTGVTVSGGILNLNAAADAAANYSN
jgi:subtilisin family serine protease